MLHLLKKNWSIIPIVVGLFIAMLSFSNPDFYDRYKMLLWLIITLAFVFAYLIREKPE